MTHHDDHNVSLQVQRFLELIEDQDVQSSCSEELSNADSGNGTSMEGETPVKKGRCNAI